MTKIQEEKIKRRDNYTCQFNKKMGISLHLNKPCSEKLVIHYKTLNPKYMKDGITVCTRCKSFIDKMIADIKIKAKETN